MSCSYKGWQESLEGVAHTGRSEDKTDYSKGWMTSTSWSQFPQMEQLVRDMGFHCTSVLPYNIEIQCSAVHS